MLHVPVGANTFCSTTPSWGTTRPAGANGTSITPGSGSYGSYASVYTALAEDAYGLLINFNSNSVSAGSRNTVATIGIDESGGTSYTDRITDLICGGAPAYNAGGAAIWYYFPIFIPAGSRIGCKANSTVTTAFRCGLVPMMMPANPALIRKGSFVNTIGASGNTGTSITPGTTSDGSWTSLGTTTNRCWWWQLGLQVTSADTSWTANAIHVDLAVGDGTNFDIIIQDAVLPTLTSEQISNPPLTAGVEWDVPAGSTIYMRAQASGTPDSGYYAVAYGLGG